MAMKADYLNGIASAGANLVKYIGLVDDQGQELSGGSYARKQVTWGSPSSGIIRPTTDLVFDVPAGATVAGWHGYSAETGGTDYGGADLDQESFTNAGQFVLLKDGTAIKHNAAS